jgi:hypothetical protein
MIDQPHAKAARLIDGRVADRRWSALLPTQTAMLKWAVVFWATATVIVPTIGYLVLKVMIS